MKILFIVISCLFLINCTKTVTHSPSPSSEQGGDSSSGGGSGITSEFFILSNRALNILARQRDIVGHNNLVLTDSYKRIHETIKNVRVEVVNIKLELNGKPYSAINTPSKNLVRISSLDWMGLSEDSKLLLVLHELLALTFDAENELNDVDFYFSKKILEKNITNNYSEYFESPVRRKHRVAEMRDRAISAASRFAREVEGIQNLESHYYGAVIINSVINPQDADVDKSTLAESNLAHGLYKYEPYSIVRVRFYAGKMERDYEVRLFPDNTVVDVRFIGEH